MGVTRNPSAARTAATTAITATATRAQRTNLTAAFLSIPDGDRHAGAPERQFFRSKRHPALGLPADRAKVPRFPADAHAIGDEPGGASADVRRSVHVGDVERV